MTLSNCTAIIRATTTTTDGLGDTTEGVSPRVLDWALIAPRASSERTDQRSPAVVTSATLYGPFGQGPDADDTVVISGHSPAMDGPWQIEGRAGEWSNGTWAAGFEVALTRADQS